MKKGGKGGGGGGVSFEIGRPRSREWKEFRLRWTRGSVVLEIGQFSWTSYVYHPLSKKQKDSHMGSRLAADQRTLQSDGPNKMYSLGYYLVVAPCCSGYHYCTTSFNKVWPQVLRRFKSCLQRVRDSRWWGSLTMAPAGNKAKSLSLVNHTTKTIHHHHIYTYTVKSSKNF